MRDPADYALPVIVGAGFALIELHVQHIGVYTMGWFYRIGMAIVLGAPWFYRRDVWYGVFATILAFTAEDALYWLFRLTPPYSWGFYLTWHHVPLLYIPAMTAMALIYTLKLRHRERQRVVVVEREQASRGNAGSA